MSYEGNPFCVTDATEQGRWLVVDFSVGALVRDPNFSIQDCTRQYSNDAKVTSANFSISTGVKELIQTVFSKTAFKLKPIKN